MTELNFPIFQNKNFFFFKLFKMYKGFPYKTWLKSSFTWSQKFNLFDIYKLFLKVGGLEKHTRTNTGEKPFNYTVCTKSFNQAGNLKIHFRVHSKGKPYSCSLCTKSFSQVWLLNGHQSSHAGKILYSFVLNLMLTRMTWTCETSQEELCNLKILLGK